MQITIRSLLILIVVIAAVMAFVSQEPIAVGLAAVFCLLSCVAIFYLAFLTLDDLLRTVREVFRQGNLSILAQRFRWAYIDGLIIVWTFFAIVVSNFILENSVANAKYAVIAAWISGPIVGSWLGWRNRPGAQNSEENSSPATSQR